MKCKSKVPMVNKTCCL